MCNGPITTPALLHHARLIHLKNMSAAVGDDLSSDFLFSKKLEEVVFGSNCLCIEREMEKTAEKM